MNVFQYLDHATKILMVAMIKSCTCDQEEITDVREHGLACRYRLLHDIYEDILNVKANL